MNIEHLKETRDLIADAPDNHCVKESAVTDLDETVELYRAAAKERDALIAAVKDIAWLDAEGRGDE